MKLPANNSVPIGLRGHEGLHGVKCGWKFLPVAMMLLLHGVCFSRASEPVIHYTFEEASEGKVRNRVGGKYHALLRAKARIVEVNGTPALSLDGQKAHALIEGSEDLHIGPEGMTLVATVRFADSGVQSGKRDALDMILFKPDEYLFGRGVKWSGTGNHLYCNLFSDTGHWSRSTATMGGETKPDEWTHVAVIIERIDERAQGKVGYTLMGFINGESVFSGEMENTTAARTTNPVNIGRGFGGPWHFHGEIAELRVYPRALGLREFQDLLWEEQLAPVKRDHRAEPDPRYPKQLTATHAALDAASPSSAAGLRNLLAVVEQAVHHVDAQAELLPYLETVVDMAKADAPDAVKEFAVRHPEFAFLGTEKLQLAFFRSAPEQVRLVSLFDLQERKELFGRQNRLWSLFYENPSDKKTLLTIDNTAEGLVSDVTIAPAKSTAILEWHGEASSDRPFAFTARMRLDLKDARLEMDLQVENHSPEIILREVVFPEIVLRSLSPETGRLLVPYQSGVLQNPRMTYGETYPSGEASMQFFAYYDDDRGIYVGMEDPLAESKQLEGGGFQEDGAFTCRWYVGSPAGEGGNGFATSGHAALELFNGNWFDAAQIYKQFAQTANWWPESRDRSDTPAWFRNLSLWIRWQNRVGTGAPDPDWSKEDALVAIREYIGLPIGTHLYSWSEKGQNIGYPHMEPLDGFRETVERLQQQDVFVKPYTDVRLWDTVANPDYEEMGKPSAVRQRDGSIPTEFYGNHPLAVMCPTASGFVETIVDLMEEWAGHGVAALYLDQIAAGKPIICFDSDHPHDPGCGKAWLQKGFWPMMQEFRDSVRAAHPHLAFDSEDAAEPYLHLLDGYLGWRFQSRARNVPAHQSIYAGRIQYTGRHGWRGEAVYPTAARQLLYGEQLGWFEPWLWNDERHEIFRLFVKKLCHARQAFLPFFNHGDTLKPLEYVSDMPVITGDFGYQNTVADSVPAVENSVWRTDDQVLALFVNSIGKPVTLTVPNVPAAWGLPSGSTVAVTAYAEGMPAATTEWNTARRRSVTVPGYGLAAWLIPLRDETSEAAKSARAATEDLFEKLREFEEAEGVTDAVKLAEHEKWDPWIVPETPLKKLELQPHSNVSQWLGARDASKVVSARGTDHLAWIYSGAAATYGPIDFGTDPGGESFIEINVGVHPRHGGSIVFYDVEEQGQEGVPFAEARLIPTGNWSNLQIQRIPLPSGFEGVKNVVIRFFGPQEGICDFHGWRLMREGVAVHSVGDHLASPGYPPLMHYTFDEDDSGGVIRNQAGERFNAEPMGNAKVVEEDGVRALSLNGTTGHLVIEESQGLHIGKHGVSILATVRFANDGGTQGKPDAHDMILFKNNGFLFGRAPHRGAASKLYFNFHDGADWLPHRPFTLMGGKLPSGQWVRTAAVLEPMADQEGYRLRLYIDGDEVLDSQIKGRTPAISGEEISIGKGWGGAWHFDGEIAEIEIYPRALTDKELEK